MSVDLSSVGGRVRDMVCCNTSYTGAGSSKSGADPVPDDESNILNTIIIATSNGRILVAITDLQLLFCFVIFIVGYWL